MIEFENYKTNLDLKDKLGLKDVDINKAMCYTGDVKLLKEKKKISTEDNKPNQPLAAAIVGLNNTTGTLPSKPEVNAWTEIDAQELLLNSKPTCYLILSKPGAGAYSLGEAMSKKFNCIHLCPKNMITDEIDQQSFTGKCIDFNMKYNKLLMYDTLLKMLKIKLESPVIQHRGYIISGFPLVTASRSPKYMVKSLYSEEAFEIVYDLLFDTIANLKKKKPQLKKSDESLHISVSSEVHGEDYEEEEEEEKVEEEELPEEEQELKVELPHFFLNTCSDIIHPIKPYYNTKKVVLLQQLNYLFSLELKPDIIIYLSCPDKDLLRIKSHTFINYKKNRHVVEPFITYTPSEVRWPVRYTTRDYIAPIDNQKFKSKYWCRQPINFENNAIEEMCNYKHDIFPFIEMKLTEIDPKFVIKLDARLTLHELMSNISERLVMMPVMPVIIPEPLFIEEPPDDLEEFWQSIQELNVIKSNDITFKRSASLWYSRCPVELKKRRSVRGNPKLAVRFLKYIYLIASLDNMISFCRNPRPYLKLKYLEPTCRIIVTGTPLSGKTMIAECLSWLFDTPIINYNDFVQAEIHKKYNTYAKTILSEIIATIEDARFAKWERDDLERIAKLDAWCELAIAALKTYIPLLNEYLRLTALQNQCLCPSLQEDLILVTSKEEIVEREGKKHVKKRKDEIIEEKETPSVEFMNQFNTIRRQLSSLPFLDDPDACNNALSKEIIVQYGPTQLTTPTKKPNLPILGDEDTMEAIKTYIVANELQNEMQPTIEELVSELTTIISSIDEKHQKQTNFDEMYGKYIIDGFPSDPEYWSILAESKLLPDYTVALIEYRETEPILIETYKSIHGHINIHQERYMSANDPLIKTKQKGENLPESDKAFDIKIILHDIIQDVEFPKAEITEANAEIDPWTSYLSDNIEKFKEDWDSIKLRLEESAKSFIDVILENKSDIDVIEEVLLRLRQSYYLPCEVNEDEFNDEEDDTSKDIITYNDPQNFGDTGKYCPITYHNHGVLWSGKPEFSVKFHDKLYRFCNEECLQLFQKDVTKYQSLNKPFKALPPLRICVIGCIGSGKTTISKLIAKELGLMHIDFAEIINNFLMPNHYKKIGRRYENIFTDVPIDDEAVVEFAMDEDNENLSTDILSNETELRRMIYNYFERGSPLLPQLMRRLITKLWFQGPFVNTGFILDGYPRLPTDIEDMTACYCIPDLVMEIEGTPDNSVKRLSPNMLRTWKEQQSAAKEKARQKIDNEKKEWMNFLTKTIVVELICDEILENISSSDHAKQLSNPSVTKDEQESVPDTETNLVKTYNKFIIQFPEPVDEIEWEKTDEVRERINSRIESIYESDDENIQSLKDNLSEERIQYVSINGNKSLIKVSRLALSQLTNLRNRCESFFEKTIIISPDIAEVLILEGFCILSKFYRMCPVYIFENPHTVQNIYSISKHKSKVFPVIHRAYIYFICGEESMKKFRTNPLKYIMCNNISKFIEYPLRISVIGAPKSGKSTLAASLAKRYGLICISRGISLRNVLEGKHWTELATKMLSDITSGKCIKSEYVIKAVQTLAMDHRSLTKGFILDGFPETASEAMDLVNYGLYPNIVFDISADLANVVQTSQKEIYYDILKSIPPYSRPLIENRYRKWQSESYKIRDWIKSDFQNVYVLDGNKSRWQCLQDAVDVISDFIPKLHYYLTNVQTSIVPAHVMCISNKTFQERMSDFKNMCPLCLNKNVIKHNAYPVDKKGVVQYRKKFYWICPEHMGMVLKYPHCYLSMQVARIPEIPATVKRINKADVYENGICIVTYAEHLPAQHICEGSHEYAACFQGKTYMFCSQKCLDKFMAKPHMYYDITVFKDEKSFPPLPLKGLPNIGYLEQTLGRLLTEACCFVNVLRPKYPGLSFQLSAVLYIALHLKKHNPDIDKAALEAYQKASKTYDARCRLIMKCASYLRSMDNPFANYPKCCDAIKPLSETVEKPSSSTSSFNSSRVPVPDERYDYLVEYHKPASRVPAFLNVVDIAGLVRGAAEGQGLGNAFLSHIKACDAIFNLCRAFDDEDVIHVDGDVNPVRDLQTIGEELRLKDEEQLMTNFEKLDRVVSRGGDKKLKPEYDSLTRIKAILVDEKKHIRFGDWSAADIEVINKYLFLTSKPALYLVNLSEKDYIRKKNKWLPKLKEWIDKNDPGAPLIPFSGVLETKLLDMEPEERKAYLKELNVTSALEKIIVQGYKALNLEYFFTAGPDEVKAWTIQKGTKAPQAAGRIHTDFEKGFIMAEVMHYKDFKEEGTEAACKSAGKYRQQGRNYVVEDGDIIFFKFNAGAGLKDAKKK